MRVLKALVLFVTLALRLEKKMFSILLSIGLFGESAPYAQKGWYL